MKRYIIRISKRYNLKLVFLNQLNYNKSINKLINDLIN